MSESSPTGPTDPTGPTGPTARERAHFEVISEAMAREKRDQGERAAADETAGGILVGLELARMASWSSAAQALDDARADSQIELRRRWLHLSRRST